MYKDLRYDVYHSSQFQTDILTEIIPISANSHKRWSYLVQNRDSKQIWQAINWNDTFDSPPDKGEKPTDEEFCAHFETLLNPQPTETFEFVPEIPKYMPVLDDPIYLIEVSDCIDDLKANKAAGIDGVPPGVLKALSAQWILLITFLFNLVFCGNYPLQWAIAKVFNIYKKGL